jgi:hypothetical protein
MHQFVYRIDLRFFNLPVFLKNKADALPQKSTPQITDVTTTLLQS